MNLTNADFNAIDNAINLLPKGKQLLSLPENERDIIINAKAVMTNLLLKKEKDNRRIRDNLRMHRAENKAYGRGGKYKGNKVAKYQIKTEQAGVLYETDTLIDAERMADTLNKNHKARVVTVSKGE